LKNAETAKNNYAEECSRFADQIEKTHGLKLIEMERDGNGFFRAVAD
jgi:hypothetical protein